MFIQARSTFRLIFSPGILTISRRSLANNMSDKKGTGTASSSTGTEGTTDREGTSTKNTETDKDSDGNRLPNLYDRFVSSFDSALASISKGDDKRKQKLSKLEIEGVADYIKQGKAKNIIVMVGAGISTSAGVPDFRSPGTGLYENLEEYNLPDPMCIFDISYFPRHPEPFYKLAKKLFPTTLKPTPCHYFIRMLDEKGLLLRCYTQNIDSLEYVANINSDKLVYAHGSHHTSTCLKCRQKYDLKWITDKIRDKNTLVAKCDKCNGIVKPDIVFFGENLPKRFFKCAVSDFPKCDLLIIMGTSLVVQPFAGLVNEVADDVPRLLINLTEAGKANSFERALGMYGLCYGEKGNFRDVFWKGTCDDGVYLLADLLGWKGELEKCVHREWNAIDERNKKVSNVDDGKGKEEVDGDGQASARDIKLNVNSDVENDKKEAKSGDEVKQSNDEEDKKNK